jgi:cyanophycin synthetase
MDVSRIRALRGPNLWSRHTAIEAIVVCDPHECNLGQITGFETELRNRFPAIGNLPLPTEHGQVSLAHVLELATLTLQSQAGCHWLRS